MSDKPSMPAPRRWHHRPAHVFVPGTAYIVTAGTLHRKLLFAGPERLALLHDTLLALADTHGWQLQAWAVLANHYHVVGLSPGEGTEVKPFFQHLHSQTARALNVMDGTPGRKVWFQYRDTCLSYETSYFARLNYVHNNPVKHGLVAVAHQYPYCSAAWFEANTEPSYRAKVESFGWERVNVPDEF